MLSPRKDYRYVSLFRMAFRAHAQPTDKQVRIPDSFSQKAVVDALQEAIDKEDSYTAYTKDGELHHGKVDKTHIRLELEEIRENKNSKGVLESYTLRFSYLNPYAADPGKEHLVTGKTETLQIGENEAGRTGAHLVMGLVEKGGARPGTVRCALEQMPGLSRGKIINNISEIAECYMSASDRPVYEYTDKKSKKTIKNISRLRVGHYSEKSESLEDDLKEKELETITFLGRPTQTDNFPISGLEDIEQKIIARVSDKHKRGSAAKETLRQAVELAKRKVLRVKVEFKSEDKHSNHKQTREIDLDKTAFADQLFTSIITIESDSDMSSIYTEIDEKVVSELKKLLVEEDHWNV